MTTQLTPEQLAQMKANADEMQDAWAENYFSDYRDEYAETAKDDIPALLGHIEAREMAFKGALQGLLHQSRPMDVLSEGINTSRSNSRDHIQDAAAKLNITLD